MWYAIVNDNVEVAPIYRCDGKVPQPMRPHENHGLAIEHLPTWPVSQCKQQLKSFAGPVQGSLDKSPKIQGDTEMYLTSAARLRFDIVYYINKLRIVQHRRLHNNSWLMTCTSSNKEYIFTMIISFSTSSFAIHANAFKTSIYIAYQFENAINTTIIRFYRSVIANTMDTADYWLMAWEYSIWNVTIASLQFWTKDLSPGTLGRTTEHFTPHFFTHLQVTCYARNLMKYCLDISS